MAAARLAYVYIQVFRALSLYIYVLLIYFGIAAAFGINFGPFAAGVIALTLLNCAYMAEIYRSALQLGRPGASARPRRASASDTTRSFLSVILPQATRVAVPSLVNQFVDIVKDSSIIASSGLPI